MKRRRHAPISPICISSVVIWALLEEHPFTYFLIVHNLVVGSCALGALVWGHEVWFCLYYYYKITSIYEYYWLVKISYSCYFWLSLPVLLFINYFMQNISCMLLYIIMNESSRTIVCFYYNLTPVLVV